MSAGVMTAQTKVDVDKIKDWGTCGDWTMHEPAVTMSWSWRKLTRQFWLRCWDPSCKLKIGPFLSQSEAWDYARRTGLGVPKFDS